MRSTRHGGWCLVNDKKRWHASTASQRELENSHESMPSYSITSDSKRSFGQQQCRCAQMIEDKLTHEAFRQPLDSSVKVWRYLNLAKFLDLLRQRNLHFSRLLQQQDKYEGMDPPGYEAAFRQSMQRDMRPDQAAAATAGVMAHHRDAASGLFINCWRYGDDESEAMWRLYCRDDQGIAVQTTYGNLVQSIAPDPFCYIGLVTYIDPSVESFSAGNIFHRAMHKRVSFKHESEVRLVRIHSEHLGGGSPPPDCMKVVWDIEAHAECVFVDPYAPPWFIDVVCDAVQRYSAPLAKRIKWSSMR